MSVITARGTQRSRPSDGAVYIAGSSLEIDRARKWRARLMEASVRVASTWVETIDQHDGTSNPRDAPREVCARLARHDFSEIHCAMVIWFLVPSIQSPTRGAWAELGYGYAMAKPIISSGDTRQSIFCALSYEYADDEEAFQHVCSIARGEVL